MRLLFVHQNFPGQYKLLVRHLGTRPGLELAGIGDAANLKPAALPAQLRLGRYRLDPDADQPGGHGLTRGVDQAVGRAIAAARAAAALKKAGFVPDVILAHPGWGEALYLREVFPDAKQLLFFEFFYRANGSDIGFDPAFPPTERTRLLVPIRNFLQLAALDGADAGVSPTLWQQSQYPARYRNDIRVVFDGLDTAHLAPRPVPSLTLGEAAPVRFAAGDEVITFINRNLEPYRGFHIFMRALPEILRRRPRARVAIVGGEGVSYGRAPADGRSWRAVLLDEVGAQLDPGRVHFLGRLPYDAMADLLRLSSVHVYLTYPFVLSWSLLEAMALGCLVVGSDTPPVREFVRDGENGLLTDFFSPAGLADRVCTALALGETGTRLRAAARAEMVARCDFRTVCLPRHLALIESLANGGGGGGG